jgi:hypothetical protein
MSGFFLRRGIIGPKSLRKLRIAWSVSWVLACVLLLALWVRSYSWMDMVQLPGAKSFTSHQGQFHFNKPIVFIGTGPSPLVLPASHYGITSVPRDVPYGVNILYGGLSVRIWGVGMVVCAIGIAPWMPQRYSLRILLIDTTLVAVVLGTVAWVMRTSN